MLAATLGALYWGIRRDLALQWWDDSNYSHGFLVPIFSAWIAWRDRATVEAVSAGGSALGLVVLLGGIGVLLLGDLAAENFLMRSSLIIILAGLVLFLLGRETFRLLLFPLAFLFFMVQISWQAGSSTCSPLQVSSQCTGSSAVAAVERSETHMKPGIRLLVACAVLLGALVPHPVPWTLVNARTERFRGIFR